MYRNNLPLEHFILLQQMEFVFVGRQSLQNWLQLLRVLLPPPLDLQLPSKNGVHIDTPRDDRDLWSIVYSLVFGETLRLVFGGTQRYRERRFSTTPE